MLGNWIHALMTVSRFCRAVLRHNAGDQKHETGARIQTQHQTTHVFPQLYQADKVTASGLVVNLRNDERIVQR